MRKIGLHLSISGGVYKALERAREFNIDALQIFLKSSNQWTGKPYTENDINNFLQLKSDYNNISVFAHSGYLINLAGEGDNYDKSINAVKDELQRAEQLGIEYLVLHPGSHKGKGIERGIERIAESIDRIFDSKEYKVKILLETTAGQGSSIGYLFEHLRQIIDSSHSSKNLGVCFDTCHVFAAGYDISEKKSYEEVMIEFNRIIGFDNLKLIHLNDSKKECGSMIDRHEHIGDGLIGTKGLGLLLNDERLASTPAVLETPKFNNDEADRMNLSRVRKIIEN